MAEMLRDSDSTEKHIAEGSHRSGGTGPRSRRTGEGKFVSPDSKAGSLCGGGEGGER